MEEEEEGSGAGRELSLTPLVDPLVLPSGAREVGGRVLAPDLLRSPPASP